MACINNIIGNIHIKHNNTWHESLYLCEDLTFVPDINQAAKLYILKSGNTNIINGDRVSINLGNKILTINNDNQIKFIDRDQLRDENDTFIINNGSDTTDPITYDTPVFLISNTLAGYALKCESSYTRSYLTNADYSTPVFAPFQLILSTNHIDKVMTKSQSPFEYMGHMVRSSFENYKAIYILIFLMFILMSCIIMGW